MRNAAFLGSRPASELSAITSALGEAAAATRPLELEPERYRETRSVGMLVLGDAGGSAGRLAIAVWQICEPLPSCARLSALGDLRSCPVVRVADHGGESTEWPSRVLRCLSGVSELCELAR